MSRSNLKTQQPPEKSDQITSVEFGTMDPSATFCRKGKKKDVVFETGRFFFETKVAPRESFNFNILK